MKLLFIRHAETDTNVKGLTHKTGDSNGLTELGRQQAEKLIDNCRQAGVEKIFTSNEVRAQETANIIAKGIECEMVVLPDLAERNWGDWEGKPWAEIEVVLKPMSLDERYTFIPPNGESWQHMEQRLQKALDEIVAKDKKAVAVVTHEGSLRGLIPILNNAPKETSFGYHFDNASITTYDFIDGKFIKQYPLDHLSSDIKF